MSQNDDHIEERAEDAPRTLDAGKPLYELGSTVGAYKLLSVLGEGGFGMVYLAEQQHPIKRLVALKVIKPGMDTKQVIARFETERQALAMLDHPNVAHVYDAGATEAGRPYFAMEYVKGIPITEYCDRYRLGTEQRLRLFIPLCQAIQHAHQKGIIHRDIKPSNTLVMLQDEKPIPKVIDFGVAKALNQRLTERTLATEKGEFIGTPEYMSPEQAELTGLDVDTRTDIYSLGVLLYALLTGRTPFDPKDLRSKGYAEMQRIIREQDPVKPSTKLTTLGDKLEDVARHRSATADQLRKSVRGDLDWIVMKAMEKDPSRRYGTADSLVIDIEHHLNNEPVQARPPSKVYRFRKLVRRNKGIFAAATVVAATLVLGLTISVVSLVREQHARRIAVAAQEKEVALRRQVQAEAYAASMNLAQQAWDQNNVGRVRQLLEETAPYPGRGFEWYYWQGQTHLEARTLRGHIGPVFSVAFSPDARWIATGSHDQTAKVWEAATGKELRTLRAQRGDVESVAFSPDGQRIATTNDAQTATVWDVTSEREVLTLRGHASSIASVVFSPDGQRMATGSYDGTAMVWNAVTADTLQILRVAGGWVDSVAFSPDGQRIVTASEVQGAQVWEATSGSKLFALEGPNVAVLSVAFSPDGQRIVTAGKDKRAKVWDAVGGKHQLTLEGHSDWVYSAAFSPDGQRLVTGSKDQTAKLWDAATGRELRTLKGHGDWVRSVAFSPDGQWIATGSLDQTTKMWTQDSDRICLEGHVAPIRSVAVSPDGWHIVTGGDDRTARVWEAVSGKLLCTLEGHTDPIRAVGYSPDGQRVVTGSDDQTVRMWDAASGKELARLEGLNTPIWSMALFPDGQQIVTGGDDQVVRILKVATGKPVLALPGHSAAIRSVAVSRDGRRIASGSLDRTAKVWDAASGNLLLTSLGHTGAIWSVVFDPNGQRIATGSDDRTAKVWDAVSGSELLTLRGHLAAVRSVAFSPDGRRIVTGSSRFSTVGPLPYLGGDDQTAKVWDAVGGKELLSLKGHSAGIWSVCFSPDGRRIVTGSYDRTARVWEAASAQQVDAWQQEEEAAAERLQKIRRERDAAVERDRAVLAQDPGAIRQWLILAPMPIPEQGWNWNSILDREQIAGESQLRPYAGQRVRVGDRDLTWREVHLADYLIDFYQLLGEATEYAGAYAVCYVQSESDRSDLVMRVGSDDAAKVFIGGKEIYRHTGGRTYLADQDVVRGVELKRGLNLVVFKIVNAIGLWQGSIRFTDAGDQPVKGIRVTLDPEAKD